MCQCMSLNLDYDVFVQALDKSNRLSEKELAEAASKWAAEKLEKADESNLPEITEYDVRHEY